MLGEFCETILHGVHFLVPLIAKVMIKALIKLRLQKVEKFLNAILNLYKILDLDYKIIGDQQKMIL